MNNRAEAAAAFLAQEIWGKRDSDAEKVASINRSKIQTENLNLELGPIHSQEGGIKHRQET